MRFEQLGACCMFQSCGLHHCKAPFVLKQLFLGSSVPHRLLETVLFSADLLLLVSAANYQTLFQIERFTLYVVLTSLLYYELPIDSRPIAICNHWHTLGDFKGAKCLKVPLTCKIFIA